MLSFTQKVNADRTYSAEELEALPRRFRRAHTRGGCGKDKHGHNEPMSANYIRVRTKPKTATEGQGFGDEAPRKDKLAQRIRGAPVISIVPAVPIAPPQVRGSEAAMWSKRLIWSWLGENLPPPGGWSF